LTNAHTSDVVLDVWHTSGGAGSNEHKLLSSRTISPNEAIQLAGVLMENADTLRGLASIAGKIAATVYYVEG
jgi:hypothetical protein